MPRLIDSLPLEDIRARMLEAERPYSAAVLQACEAIGYGRVLQIVEEAWRKKDPVGAKQIVKEGA